jgi:hypothetical protein
LPSGLKTSVSLQRSHTSGGKGRLIACSTNSRFSAGDRSCSSVARQHFVRFPGAILKGPAWRGATMCWIAASGHRSPPSQSPAIVWPYRAS